MQAARRLVRGTLHCVDVGHARAYGVGGRHFVLWAGVGLDAEVVRRVEDENQALKKTMGSVAYAAVGVRSLLEATGTAALLRHDSRRMRLSLLMAVVANVPLYAGTIEVAPGARIDDGQFDLVTFAGQGPPDTLRYLAGLTAGRGLGGGGESALRAHRVSLVAAHPMPVHLDAEPFGHTPFSATIVPGALRLLVPEGAPRTLFVPPEGEASAGVSDR